MKILLTGAAGFIGSHFAETLLEEGHQVISIDNLNPFYDPTIKEQNLREIKKRFSSDQFTDLRGDIRDTDFINDVFKTHHPEEVVHLAAMAGVRPSIADPVTYQEVNIRGTMNLLEAMKKYEVSRMVFASSSSVYGNNPKVPFAEDDFVDHPISPYAATKKAGELICYTYHHLYQFTIVALRFFTVYGPRQRPEMAIHKFTRLIDEGKPVPMFGDGTTKRDYTYIDDIIDGMIRVRKIDSGFHLYNLGESRTTALIDLIRMIEAALGKKANIQRLPLQPGDVNITYADISRARKELGYDPHTTMEEGIERFVEWYNRVKG
ncbi:MAG: GDP-mannose 4,6-dehydratase [Deltaproteobacteria bacterium]|nr:GDP-mannose 4,6-dehydratase [Deltaproteobacteria bacterium]